MNKNVLRLAGFLVLILSAGGASAKNIFVSTDSSWKMPGMSGDTYTSLPTAIGKVVAGDTVWVKDGYVCESGTTSTSISGHDYARIRLPKMKFTLRSESGYVDEANGKGAYVRGGKSGSDAVRPIWSQSKETVVMGFVLEGGETMSDQAGPGSGGAVYGQARIENCVIRNCTALYGGAFGNGNVTAYNTVITNCHSKGTVNGGGAVYGGGSLYGCTVADNSAAGSGGAIFYDNSNLNTFYPVYSNCVFRNNAAGSSSGCANYNSNKRRATFIDCKIVDNHAETEVGGVRGMATFVRCVIAGNVAGNGDVGGVGARSTDATAPAAWPLLTDCVVSNNVTSGKGGGLYCGIATNCVFVGNQSAGATVDVSAGGQAYYNCLFGGNRSDNGKIVEGNAETKLEFYNCTVAGNESPKASCVNGVNFHNSIIWGNVVSGDELTACTAEYSCQKDLADGENGNTNKSPQLTPDYRLSKGSPCVDTAKYYGWMQTVGDARPYDAAGYPRVRCPNAATDPKPDRGCYERESPGTLVIGR